MRAIETPVVVKFGGSFAFSPHLPHWIEALADCAGRAVIVPGGGPFADAVRAAQSRIGFDDRAAHQMAVLAMEQYGCALASLHRAFSAADSAEAIVRVLAAGRVPVWMPARMVLETADIAPSWELTADSLAVWLAGKIGAHRLLLVKHAASLSGRESPRQLAEMGIVDATFPRYLGMNALRAFILGPADYGSLRAAVRDGAEVGSAVD